jgi:hypothetical protein
LRALVDGLAAQLSAGSRFRKHGRMRARRFLGALSPPEASPLQSDGVARVRHATHDSAVH